MVFLFWPEKDELPSWKGQIVAEIEGLDLALIVVGSLFLLVIQSLSAHGFECDSYLLK